MTGLARDLLSLWVMTTAAGTGLLVAVVAVQGALARVRRRRVRARSPR